MISIEKLYTENNSDVKLLLEYFKWASLGDFNFSTKFQRKLFAIQFQKKIGFHYKIIFHNISI